MGHEYVRLEDVNQLLVDYIIRLDKSKKETKPYLFSTDGHVRSCWFAVNRLIELAVDVSNLPREEF